MTYYFYFIAGVKILCKIPFPVVIQREAEEFLFYIKSTEEIQAAEKEADVQAEFVPSAYLPEIPENAVQKADRYYSRDREGRQMVHYCPCPGKEPYACAIWEKIQEACSDCPGQLRFICRYLPGSEFRFGYSRMISDHIGMETLFLQKDCLLLHASFISWKEKGILFTGPSGIGKSTQANLWHKYENVEILNGDRAAVKKGRDGWYAYGLPYAGSSGIYRNESARLETVIVLRQAERNRIRKLGLLETIQSLYPEVMIHHWDREFIEKALTILTEMSGDIPFCLLECRPDREAVETVKKWISEGAGLW